MAYVYGNDIFIRNKYYCLIIQRVVSLPDLAGSGPNLNISYHGSALKLRHCNTFCFEAVQKLLSLSSIFSVQYSLQTSLVDRVSGKELEVLVICCRIVVGVSGLPALGL